MITTPDGFTRSQCTHLLFSFSRRVRRNIVSLLAVVIFTLLGSKKCSAQIVSNGSFELPALSASSYVYEGQTGVPGWSFFSSGGLISPPSAFSAPAAPDGAQIAFLQSASAAFSQTVVLPTNGSYTLAYFVAARPGAGNVTYSVFFDSAEVVSNNKTISGQPFIEQYVSITATAGSHLLLFTNSANMVGDNTAFFDAVQINGGAYIDDLPTNYWSGGGDGMSWSDPQNWVGNQMPGPGSNVVVTNGLGTNVVINSPVSVLSIFCNKALTISDGFLAVAAGSSFLQAPLTLSGTSTLWASGIGTSFTCDQQTEVDNASLYASAGASLSLPGVVAYTDNSGDFPVFQASGLGSALVMEGLTNILDTYQYYGGFDSVTIQALAGGRVTLSDVTSIQNGVVEADGTNSLVDLSTLAEMSVGSAYGEYAPSRLEATDGGIILTPQMETLNGVALVLNGTNSLNLNSLKTLEGSALVLTNGSLTLSNLVNIDNESLYVSNGATLWLPNVMAYTDNSGDFPVFQASGLGSTLIMDGLTNILDTYQYYGGFDSVTIQALAGGRITLPDVISIQNGVADADGTNSLVDLSSLTEMSVGSAYGEYAPSRLEATDGGTILLPKVGTLSGVTISNDPISYLNLASVTNLSGAVLTVTDGLVSYTNVINLSGAMLTVSGHSLTLSDVTNIDNASLYVNEGASLSLPAVTTYNDSSGDAPVLQASGAGSLLALDGLTNITETYEYYGSRDFTSIQALNGGHVDMGSAISFLFVNAEADGVDSVIRLSSLDEINSVLANSDFFTYPGGQWRVTDGGTVLVGQLGSLNGVNTFYDATSALDLNAVTNFNESVLTLTNGSVILTNIVDIDNAAFYISGGATLSLPGVTNYNDTAGDAPFLQASGPGSVLTLPNLTNISHTYSAYDGSDTLTIQALAAGRVELSNVTSITGWPINLTSDGTNSVVDLSSLSAFYGVVPNSDFFSYPGSQMHATDSGTILLRDLKSLNGVNVPLDKTGTLTLTTITNFDTSVLTVTNGSLVLPNIVEADSASFIVTNGASLSLPGIADYDDTAGYGPSLTASGAGSVLELANLTNVSHTYSAYDGSDVLSIQALQGGNVNLADVTSITGWPIYITASGFDSAVDLSSLTYFYGVVPNSDFFTYPASQLIASGGGTVALGQLTTLDGVTVPLDLTGTLNLSTVVNLNESILILTNGSLTLGNVTNIDNASFYVSGGATLSLPGVSQYNNTSGDSPVLQASGAGSVLSLSGLTTVSNTYFVYDGGNTILFQSLLGGRVILASGVSFDGNNIEVETSGAGSVSGLPVLNMANPGGNMLVISWLAPSGGFHLQQNSSLDNADWTPATNAVNIIDGENQVIIPITNGSQFYRLAYP